MDLVIELLDPYMFEPAYTAIARLIDPTWTIPPASNPYRLFLTTTFVLWMGGTLLYLACAGLSWVFLFDKSLRKDKFFLPNQEYLEIKVALWNMIWAGIAQAFPFYGEAVGYSRLHMKPIVGTTGWLLTIGNCLWFLMFTDALIYWIHRGLHHPWFYGPIHKLHHKWIVPTPFASHAFHWLDGYLQGIPYHIFVYLFPMHKVIYLCMFITVNCWTVSIHDGAAFYKGGIINGSEHHTIHHKLFNYNYGQYFTLWDRIGGTHRQPELPGEKKAD